jgi:uncharacterized protein (TIGR03437 family)
LLSPGSWVSIYGVDFAAAPQTAQCSAPLPVALGGVSITVGGALASLSYVSPTQINALIPFFVTIPSVVVPLAVTTAAGSGSYNIRLTRDAPAIFTRDGSGLGMALAFDAKFHPVATVHPNDVIIVYAAGLGPTDDSGRVTDPVEVYLGERKAPVT